jgi:hypothetical protein
MSHVLKRWLQKWFTALDGWKFTAKCLISFALPLVEKKQKERTRMLGQEPLSNL